MAIIDHGKIAALDTPENLKNMITDTDTTIFSVKITNLNSQLMETIQNLENVTAMSQQT